MIKKRIMAAVIALLLIVNVSPMSLVAYAESDMGTEEVTLSASPDTLTCIITFDMCGHGESIEAVEAEAGACIDKPNDPEAEGFIFDGWYVDKEYTTAWVFETNAVIGDTVLYARWIAEEQIQVSLDTQLFAQYTGERQESLTELTPEPTLESTPEPTPESMPESTPEPTPESTPEPTPESTPEPSPIIIYTVTFNSLGHGTVIESIAVEAGTLLTKPDDPSEAGFDFEGWYADQEHTSIWNFETDTVNENITLFAKWSEAEQASEDSSAEQETAEAACPAFGQSRTVNGVTVHVSAPEGVFPMNASLSVELVPVEAQPQVDAAVETERESGRNVAVSYTFDIKVLDPEGNELQPGEGQSVNVSFTLTEVANENLTTEVYHVSESEEGGSLSAEVMKVETNEATATVTTEGFSFYTVEFTYGEKQYVLAGDGVDVSLTDILGELNLVGEVTAVEVSDPSLILVAEDEADGWRVASLAPFTTEELLKVTIDGISYEILLTDSYVDGGASAASGTFASGAPLATITIDHSKLVGAIDTDIFLENVSPNYQRVSDIRWNGTTLNAYGVTFQNSTSSAAPSRVGSFVLRYKDAAITSNGERKDLRIAFDVTVFPRTDINTQETRDIGLFDTVLGNTPTFSPRLRTFVQGRGGVRYDMRYQVVDSSSAPVPGTYVFSAYGFNLNNSPSAGAESNNHDRVLYCDANYEWAESINIQGGAQSDIYVPGNLVSSYGGTTLYANSTSRGQSNDRSYVSGEVAVVDAQSLQTWVQSYFAYSGAATNCYLLPDGVTHRIRSSSGYYGKIETWRDGTLDGSGWLYGGRYEPNSAYETPPLEEYRWYDVPNGKTVTYKMTPEPGFIMDTLTVTGDGTISGVMYTAHYTDGHTESQLPGTPCTYSGAPIDFYEFTFPASTSTDDDAFAIHVTWQPAVTLNLEKIWEDDNDRLGLRPGTLAVELNDPSGTLDASEKSVTLTANDNWQHSWYSLPKYSTYDSGTNTGTLYVYTVTETLDAATANYYTELLPHVVEKTDVIGSVQYYADGMDENHWNFDETGTYAAAQHVMSRELDYTIVNRLYTGGLAIEKDSVPDDDGSFDFEVTLNHPYADFSQLGFSGTVGGDWTKTVSAVGGDSIHWISGLPAGTTYRVTEKVPDGWKLLGSSGASGEILAGDFWAYDVGGTLFIKDGAGYVNTSGQQIPLPTDPAPLLAPYYGTGLGAAAGTYTFDKIGAEIESGNAGYAYRYGDRGSVPPETLPGWDVSYTKQSAADGQYVVYRSNNANAGDTVIGTAVDRARFTNLKLVELTVGKKVTGNQASRDKYFKVTVDLKIDSNNYRGNLDFKDESSAVPSFGADWIAEMDIRKAVKAPSQNAATVYTQTEMANANGHDGIPSLTYSSASGSQQQNNTWWDGTYYYYPDGGGDWTVTDQSGAFVGTDSPPGNATCGMPGQQILFDSNGVARITFYLQHGNSVTLKGLPYGVSYTVTEEAEDYRPETEILSGDVTTNENGSGGGADIMLGNLNQVRDTSMLTDTALQFTNTRAGIIPTGLADSIRPALFGLGLAGALMLVLLLQKAGRRRGKHERA